MFSCSFVSDSLGPCGLYLACQSCLSMELSRPENWSELPFPSSGDLPKSGAEHVPLESLALAGRFFTTMPPEKSNVKSNYIKNTFFKDLGTCIPNKITFSMRAIIFFFLKHKDTHIHRTQTHACPMLTLGRGGRRDIFIVAPATAVCLLLFLIWCCVIRNFSGKCQRKKNTLKLTT